MCAYFEQDLAKEELDRICEELGLGSQPGDEGPRSVRPTDPAVVIARGGLRVARFGFLGPSGALLMNARVETLEERATFRPLLTEGRCLVPMTSFEESGVRDGHRARMRFASPAGPVLGVGLLREDRFVLVTRQAGAEWVRFHERMPALVDLEAGRDWLAAGALTLAEPALAATPSGSSAGRHPGQAAL